MTFHHKKNNLFSALSLWVMGWSIFSLIEILMRLITGPLAMADQSTFAFMALLSFFSYILLAILTGSILHSIIRLLSDRRFPQLSNTRRDCFHISASIAVMISLHGILFIDAQLITEGVNYTTLLFHSGVLTLCLLAFLSIYRIFSLIQDRLRMLIR